MNDRKLDKLFKKKLGNRDFDYQDSYWADFEKSYNIDGALTGGTSGSGGSLGNIISGAKIGLIAAPVIIITSLAVFTPNQNNQAITKKFDNNKPIATVISNQNSSQNFKKNTKLKDESVKSINNNSNETIQLTAEDFAATKTVSNPSELNKNMNETTDFQSVNNNNSITYPSKQRDGAVSFNDNSGPTEPSTKTNNTVLQDVNNDTESFSDDQNQENTNPNIANNSWVALAASESLNNDKNPSNTNYESYEETIQTTESATTTINNNSNNYLDIETGRIDNFIVMSKSLDGSETQVDSTLKTKQAVIGAYRPNRIRPVFSLAGYGGVAFISKELTSGLPEFSKMISQRNELESNKTAFSLGLEFETRYRGFSFTTGINRMSWGENVNYISSPETLVVTDTTYIEIIDNSYWEVIPVDSNNFDSIYIVEIDTNIVQFTDTLLYEPSDKLGQANGKTKITYVEIPILVGYEFYFDKLILAIKGGVSVGFLTQTSGFYLNESATDLIPINTQHAVLKKTLWNLELGLGVGYKFYPKFDVFLNTGYKMNLNSVFSDPGVIQKYKAITLGIKLRYTF